MFTYGNFPPPFESPDLPKLYIMLSATSLKFEYPDRHHIGKGQGNQCQCQPKVLYFVLKQADKLW